MLSPAAAQVVANAHHTCLRDVGGLVRCVGGDTTVDPPMTPVPADRFLAIATSRRTACGVRAADGGVTCWGACTADTCTPPEGGGFGGLALHDDGGGCAWGAAGVACWGAAPAVHAAARALEAVAVRQVDFGSDWGLALAEGGRVVPFGKGLGVDPAWAALGPQASVAVAGATGCTVDVAGVGRCRVAYGAPPPPEASGRALGYAFSAPLGAMPACVLDAAGAAVSGRVRCTPGVKGRTPRLAGEFVELTAGDEHVCGRTAEGSVQCAGADDRGAVSGRQEWPSVSLGG